MTLTVDIAVEDRSWKRREPELLTLTPQVLKAALKHVRHKAKTTEISIVYSNDNAVQELNRAWRGRDKPTNVLSFPQHAEHLGDIVMAYQTISREAKEQRKSFRAHLTHLLIHGLLHLLGHDHENDRDAAKMEKLEVQIMAGLGYADPYQENT